MQLKFSVAGNTKTGEFGIIANTDAYTGFSADMGVPILISTHKTLGEAIKAGNDLSQYIGKFGLPNQLKDVSTGPMQDMMDLVIPDWRINTIKDGIASEEFTATSKVGNVFVKSGTSNSGSLQAKYVTVIERDGVRMTVETYATEQECMKGHQKWTESMENPAYAFTEILGVGLKG